MGSGMRKALAVGLGVLVAIAGIFLLVTADHDRLYDDPKALGGSANSYSAILFVNSRSGDGWSGSVGKLSGVHEVATIHRGEEAPVTVTCRLEVTSGKAKLVWADPEGNVTTLLEGCAGEEDTLTLTLIMPEGTNRFKVAGADKAACAWRLELAGAA